MHNIDDAKEIFSFLRKVCVPKKVEREPYTGPVVQLPQDNPAETPLSPVQYSKKDRDEKVSRVGHRDLHSSGFSLGGKSFSMKFCIPPT